MKYTNEKDLLCADFAKDPIQNLINWRDGIIEMDIKKSRPSVLKLIKIRPEVFEKLKEDIPFETKTSISDLQVSQYFSVPFVIAPELKNNIEYIYT